MKGLIGAQLSNLVGSLDIFHLLKVLTGVDQPTEREIKDLTFVKHILTVPTAGDFAWGYLAKFLSEKGWSELFLAQLNAGMQAHKLTGTPPTDIAYARESFVDILSAILDNPERFKLHAISQCPYCLQTFGVS